MIYDAKEKRANSEGDEKGKVMQTLTKYTDKDKKCREVTE